LKDVKKNKKKVEKKQKIESTAAAVKKVLNIKKSIKKSSKIAFSKKSKSQLFGKVISVQDGILLITECTLARVGGLVSIKTSNTNLFGMVLNIEENFKKVVLFGNDRLVLPNTPVRLTGNLVKVPVGPSVLGRVLDSLGNPIDSKKPLKALGYKRIEIKAPGIIVRQPVTEPVYTGILAIDSMIPVGRGQRELIIGDRQTGKTTIAIDAILNQKSYFAKKNKKDFLYCIYVAIGQKRSSLAHIYGKLKKKSALSYSVLIGATASDPASLQYIAPYAGASIGE
jgi:proton translocating ATP synthase F1 alpha subunit